MSSSAHAHAASRNHDHIHDVAAGKYVVGGSRSGFLPVDILHAPLSLHETAGHIPRADNLLIHCPSNPQHHNRIPLKNSR